MKRSHWKWLWISLTFTTLVLIGVLYFTIDEKTFEYIRRLNPFYLILAFLLHFVSLSIWAVRIQKMAAFLGYRVSFRYCLQLVLANLFVAAITPSQAGGEPIRIHQLYRAGVPVGDSTALVIMERVFDAIVLGITGAIVIALLGSLIGSPSSPAMIALYVSWFLMVLTVVLFLYAVRSPKSLKRLAKGIFGWFLRRWDGGRRFEAIFSRIDREVDNFHGGLCHFLKHGKGGFLGWPIVLTVAFWAGEFFTASLLLMGLGEAPHVVASFVAQIILTIIMMVPLTPGGSGIAEVGATSLYSLFVSPSIVGVFVVLWRMIFYYFNLVVGFFAGLAIIRREATTVTVE
jgi:uncharacterized protein (TIRG00374 family)